MTDDARIEKIARDLRAQVRKKAGLMPMWDAASESMKDWYRRLARMTVAGQH